VGEDARVAVGDGDARAWHKSSRSGATGACVEVRVVDGAVQVRDSKNPDGPVLTVPPDAWAEFVAGVAGGDFDWPAVIPG
jgi:Domain of unknown function (DUF397)